MRLTRAAPARPHLELHVADHPERRAFHRREERIRRPCRRVFGRSGFLLRALDGLAARPFCRPPFCLPAFFCAAFFFAMGSSLCLPRADANMFARNVHALEVRMLRRVLVFVFAGIAIAGSALAQQNRIDTVTPSAPELASWARNTLVGVRTRRRPTSNSSWHHLETTARRRQVRSASTRNASLSRPDPSLCRKTGETLAPAKIAKDPRLQKRDAVFARRVR